MYFLTVRFKNGLYTPTLIKSSEFGQNSALKSKKCYYPAINKKVAKNKKTCKIEE